VLDRRQDPRSIVTPYAFSVHPDLLGRPLATPWQRLGAILVDLLVIALLTRIGFLTLAVGSALLLVSLMVRKPSRDVMGKLFRVAVGCLGVVVATITILVVVLARSSGPGPDQPRIEDILEEALGGVASPEATVSPAAAAPDDTLAVPEGLPEAPEVAQAEELEEQPPDAAMDSIRRLNVALESLRDERDESRATLRRARQELAQAEDRSPLQWLTDLVEDLGLGFGWGALYLTITHAWWKGTSVGKRLFRIRVVMIDKRPLSLWLSFERAGGYAAGFATGLLGFAQVFWDPNRQAIHDKISETIVVQDGKEPVPGPWIKEGEARWVRGRSRPLEPGSP
jgi:hypothetical protein